MLARGVLAALVANARPSVLRWASGGRWIRPTFSARPTAWSHVYSMSHHVRSVSHHVRSVSQHVRSVSHHESPHVPETQPDLVLYMVSHRSRHRIYSVTFHPQGKELGIVFIAHGFAEHCVPYYELARRLAGRGLVVVLHDHVGHGRSDGTKGLVDSVDTYVGDVLQRLDMVKKSNPGLPTFIVGHSMGGTIAIKTALKRPEGFSGMVLVAPALVINPELATPLRMSLARILGTLLPQFPVGSISPDSLTRDKSRLDDLLQDELRYHGYTKAGWGHAMIKAFEDIHQEMPSLSMPLLLLHGDQDKVCCLQGSQILFDGVGSKDKELKVYPGAMHGLFIELEDVRQKTMGDIEDWICKRIPK